MRGGLARLAAFGVALLLVGAATADEGTASDPVPPSEGLVRNLIAALDHDDADYRLLASQELGDHPVVAAELGAAPVLVRLALEDPSLEVREAALWSLGDLGPVAREDALPALWALADWEAPQPGKVQGIAAWAIARMEPPAEEAAPRLVPLVIHYDDFTRAAAADGVATLGEPMLPFLLLALATQEGSGSAGWVVDAIGVMGEPAAPAIPVLLELRGSTESDWLRSSIDHAIVRIGGEVPARVEGDRVAELAEKLGSGPDYSKRVAARGLAELGPAAAEAVPALEQALNDPEVAQEAWVALLAIVPEEERGAVVTRGMPLLRTQSWDGLTAALALAEAGPAGEAGLVAALADGEGAARYNALHGLQQLPPGKAAYRPIRRLLADDSGEVRAEAARALARYGERVMPTLERAIRREQDGAVEAQMIGALGAVGPRAIPTLRGALADDRREVREAAASAVGDLGDAGLILVPELLDAAAKEGLLSNAVGAVEALGPGAIPDLLGAVESHPNAEVRKDAALALARLEPLPEPVIPVLARALDDEDAEVRQWVAFALGQQGPAAAPAVEDLRAALTDPEPWVRQNAAWALGEIGDPAHVAIPDLIAVVEHDRDTFPPEKAAEALGRFGSASGDAVEPLARALDDDDNEYKRRAAARSLVAIGVTSPYVQAQLRARLDDPKARVRWAAGDALMVLGEPDDLVPAMVVVRRAPDEAREEDYAVMEEFNRSMQWLEEPRGDE